MFHDNECESHRCDNFCVSWSWLSCNKEAIWSQSYRNTRCRQSNKRNILATFPLMLIYRCSSPTLFSSYPSLIPHPPVPQFFCAWWTSSTGDVANSEPPPGSSDRRWLEDVNVSQYHCPPPPSILHLIASQCVLPPLPVKNVRCLLLLLPKTSRCWSQTYQRMYGLHNWSTKRAKKRRGNLLTPPPWYWVVVSYISEGARAPCVQNNAYSQLPNTERQNSAEDI